MACSPQVILKESASILGGYCGKIGNFSHSIGWSIREKITEVQNLVNDITLSNKLNTLPQLAERLNFLQRETPAFDALHGYIDEVRRSIETRLYNLNKQDFELVATSGRFGQILSQPILRRTPQFWELMDLTRENQRARIVREVHRHGCIKKALLTDFPEETLAMVFNYSDRPLPTIFESVTLKEQLTNLLSRWDSLPSDMEKSNWLIPYSYHPYENLLSLTLKFLPSRFHDVFSYLDNLHIDAQSSILFHSVINLAERAIDANAFDILCRVLAKIQSLPDTVRVNDFLEKLVAQCFAYQSYDPLSLDQRTLYRAQLLLNAMIRMSEPSSVCRFLQMETRDTNKINVLNYIARYSSSPAYKSVVVFAETLEKGDMKKDLMYKLFWNGVGFPQKAKVLISYVLENPAIQARWLSYTTKDGWNLLHIAAAHKVETSGLVGQLLECMKIHLSPSRVEQMLAQKNSVGNTPLAQAAIRSSGAVGFFMEPIMQCRDPLAILSSVNDLGEAAVTLAEPGTSHLISRFFKRATLPICHAASSSVCDDAPVERVVDDECFTKTF